mgnify:CR=1 FL=1
MHMLLRLALSRLARRSLVWCKPVLVSGMPCVKFHGACLLEQAD